LRLFIHGPFGKCIARLFAVGVSWNGDGILFKKKVSSPKGVLDVNNSKTRALFLLMLVSREGYNLASVFCASGGIAVTDLVIEVLQFFQTAEFLTGSFAETVLGLIYVGVRLRSMASCGKVVPLDRRSTIRTLPSVKGSQVLLYVFRQASLGLVLRPDGLREEKVDWRVGSANMKGSGHQAFVLGCSYGHTASRWDIMRQLLLSKWLLLADIFNCNCRGWSRGWSRGGSSSTV
jgi:hypothetical protein